jgi:hypothetical protein
VPGLFDPYHRWLGIPPKNQPANHYRLLGIDLFESDREVIRDAAEQRMAHVRTYQLGQYSDLSQKILNELAAAKACLLDPQGKAAYDRKLSTTSDKSETATRVPATLSTFRSMPPLPVRPTSRPKSLPLVSMVAGGTLLMLGLAVAFVLARNEPETRVAHNTELEKRPGGEQGDSTSSPKSPLADALKNQNERPKSDAPREERPETRQSEASPKKTKTPDRKDPSKREEGQSATAGSVLTSLPPEPNKSEAALPEQPVAARKEPLKSREKAPLLNRDFCGLFTISLPSDAELTESMVEFPNDWEKSLFPEGERGEHDHCVIRFDCDDANRNSKVKWMFTMRGKIPDGPAAMLYPSGRLRTLIFYDDKGNRTDSLKQWDENDKPVFYAQYSGGYKHGLVCLFKTGMPWLIEEWDRQDQEKSQSRYLVKWSNNAPSLPPVAQLIEYASAENDAREEMDSARQQLTELERTIKANEDAAKQKSTAPHLVEKKGKVKKKEDTKRKKAAEVSRKKREATSERLNERHEQNQRNNDELNKRLRRGG